MLGVVFWAAVFVGSLTIGALVYFLLISRSRGAGSESAGGQGMKEGGWAISQPAEEGAQLDEWIENRIDQAA